jgi:hypothetical protein
MAKLLWIFLRNIFEIITRNSTRKMDSISEDHDLKLSDAAASNPIIAVIYNTFHPLREAFHQSYVKYKAAIAAAQGSTQAIQNMWKKVSSELLDQWDTEVKKVYKRDSDEHKALFPNGHEPFRIGTYAERITHIEALLSNIDDYNTLGDAKAMVETFLTDYETLNQTNKTKHNAIKTIAVELKENKKKCAVAMYSNLGYLIYKYPTQPDLIGSFYDITQIVRSTPKTEGGEAEEKTYTLPAETTVEAGFPFTAETKIHYYVSGTEELYLFTKSDKNDTTLPENPKVVQPEEEGDIVMYTLGDSENRYFFIANKSGNVAEIVIDLVE